MKMTKMSGKGDEVVAEWEDTASKEKLDEIEKEFNRMTRNGYFAASLATQELIKEFDPKVDILMIPNMQGGA